MGTADPGVAPDGSPVALYLAVPGDEDAAFIDSVLPAGAAVLELGCGVGRVSRHLAALGHAVTGVDNSPEMLAQLLPSDGIETVLADIRAVDLRPRRWPVVLLASRMINDEHGASFLATAARHLAPGGWVLVERHDPGWIDTVETSSAQRYGMTMAIRVDARPAPGILEATMQYDVGDAHYEHAFTAYDVDDARLDEMAAAVGLRVDAVVNEAGSWVRLKAAA